MNSAEQRDRAQERPARPRRGGGRSASHADIKTAPTAGAARRTPSPCGPTCRISSAKIGRIATAPPNSTANRSSVIAPRNSRRAKDERQPLARRWPAGLADVGHGRARRDVDAQHGDDRHRHQRRGDQVRRRGARPGRRAARPAPAPTTAATCQMPGAPGDRAGVERAAGPPRRPARCAPAAGSCAPRRRRRSRRRCPS